MSAFSARLSLTSRLLSSKLYSFIMPGDGNHATQQSTVGWVALSKAQRFERMVGTVDSICAPGKVRAL